MEESVRRDILNILDEGLKAVNEVNILKLKELSDHTIHDAGIFQDKDSVTIAVLMYALAKIYERPRYTEYKDWGLFSGTVVSKLKLAFDYLNRTDLRGYEINIKDIFSVVEKLDSKLRDYAKEVIEKAKVSKGSRIHEHGISIGRTAEILGISKWELGKYVGGTGISDVDESITKDIKHRLKFTRGLFV